MDSGGSALDEKALGKRLQVARQQAGLTQQALCQKANLSYSTLAKIERGAIKAPSIFTIQSIAATLHTSLDELVGVSLATQSTKRVSKSGVRFVYFDLNGCLVRFASRGFTQLAHDSGQPLDVVESVYWRLNDAVCRGEMSVDDLNHRWAKQLGITVDWQRYYLEAVDRMPGVDELVAWTAEYYHVGIMTNTMPGFVPALKQRGTIPALPYDAIIDSSEVHALKPEPRIYEAAAARAGVEAHEILLIDDDRINLTAAEEMGWRTIWFDSYRPEESVEAIRTALEPA